MRTISILLLCTIAFTSFIQPPKYFTGKIVYHYEFKDANGKDLTDAMAPFVGKEQHYFINDKNYKSLNEKGVLMQLYNSASNLYYQPGKDKSLQKVDASVSTSKVFTVRKLEEKATIAGYKCNAIEILTDDASTYYYYSPLVKANPATYQKHGYGEWNKILQATGGALPLKFKMVLHKQGFIVWTSTADVVKREVLKDEDFAAPVSK